MGASDYILVADWKMKWLAMVWREIQQEWFGKSGVCMQVHTILYVWIHCHIYSAQGGGSYSVDSVARWHGYHAPCASNLGGGRH